MALTATDPPVEDALVRLARARGIEVSYEGADGATKAVAEAGLVKVLGALGEPIAKASEAAALFAEHRRARRAEQAGRGGLPPVLVAWDGELGARARPAGSVAARLVLEGGEERPIDAPGRLPLGYHAVRAGGRHLAHVIAAPGRLSAREAVADWALFAPTYAIVDERGRPAGDLSSLERLGEFAAARGAAAVATLPLLAEPATADGGAPGQQPYLPLSRTYWNEAVLDVSRLPELDPADAALIGRRGFWPAARRDHDGRELADLAGLASLLRPVLERAAERLLSRPSRRRDAFAAYRREHPDLERYGWFRAAMERFGPDPSRWPARAAEPGAAPVNATAAARHAYAQFATDAQLAEVATALEARGTGLLLDLPIGCGPKGYDPFAHPEAFATGASIGAPPDAFFAAGQNWSFPPPDPETDRRAGYPMARAVLAHHLRHARYLRIDHVLAWRRLWWVPVGAEATEGAYVRYPTEELMALACLEAERAGARLVGEDLGTVPRGLRPRLSRRGVWSMRVAVFDLAARPGRRLSPAPGTAAYLATHDTATFAAFVTGEEIAGRERLGLLAPTAAATAAAEREVVRARLSARLVRAGRLEAEGRGDPAALCAAVAEELGASPAGLVVVSVDDLIGEREAHNVPGTTSEHANFARRLPLSLADLARNEQSEHVLSRLKAARSARGVTKMTAG
ncbi:MAG: 4-alpha-glucanotransferase [Actinomycetota bacterium]|nr:4-alpha-glucanotransferase [Actinomycetota bacterium]